MISDVTVVFRQLEQLSKADLLQSRYELKDIRVGIAIILLPDMPNKF